MACLAWGCGGAHAFTLSVALGAVKETNGRTQTTVKPQPPIGNPDLKWAPMPGASAKASSASTETPAQSATSALANGQASTVALGPLSWPALLSRIDQSADARAAQADAQASAALGRQQWAAAWMPRLDASATSAQQNQRYNGLSSQTPSSSTSLTATLPVWRPAERAVASAQATTAEQARWQARSRQVALAQELSQAWLDAAEAAEQQRLTQDHLQQLDVQLKANERRLQAGLGTVLDPLETRTRIAQVQAQADQLAARVRTQALTIQRLAGPGASLPRGLSALPAALDAGAPHAGTRMGISMGVNLSPIASVAWLPQLPPLDDALQTAAERNPALQDARTGAQAADQLTRARRAEAWQPTLDATASASRTRQTQRFEGVSEQQNVSSRAVGVALNWPLLTGGYQLERQNEAAAVLSAAQARADAAQARVDTGLRDAYQRQEQAQSRLARLTQLVDSAQATQDALTKAWAAGLRNHTELLNAQQALFDARLGLATARVAAMQAQVDALAQLDWLDADHIAPLMGQFDF
jgi:outer membrane protein